MFDPGFDGASSTCEWKEALWARFYTGAPRPRTPFERSYSDRKLRSRSFLFVAVDRISKLVFARIYRQATKLAATAFLKVLVRTVPYRIHTVLTDNGVEFVQLERGGNRGFLVHIFERTCRKNGIEHRLTNPYHPWTNGQAERMVRTIKEATVRSFHYASISKLRQHVRDWLTAYNFAKQLKALRFKTPYDVIEQLWKSKPDIFNTQPHHQMPGLNT